MNQFSHLIALLGVSVPVLVSPALAEEGKLSAHAFVHDGMLPLLNAYNEQVGKVIRMAESDKEVAAAIKKLTEDTAPLWALIEGVLKDASPEFEKELVAMLKTKETYKTVRRTLFTFSVEKTDIRDNAAYYGQNNVQKACESFEAKIAPFILFLHQHRFNKKISDTKLVEYMVAYQDREMVVHDIHHILDDVANKKKNDTTGRWNVGQLIPRFLEIRFFIEKGLKSDKKIVQQAYKQSESEKWTNWQVKQLKARINKIKNANTEDLRTMLGDAKMVLGNFK